jgi:paraquat-inducible protein B
MPDDVLLDDLPRARVMPPRRRRISVVWAIPVLAAVVAIGVAVQRILSEGPTITIVFKTAEGLEAGKTYVKYKDVNIGQVSAVKLSKDYSRVEVTAKMSRSAAGLMVEDARFWIVEPRVTLSGISGLGTILSGNYIGFEMGKSSRKQRTFTGLEVAPVVTGLPGRQFRLTADNLGSLGVGSPIYYRRLQAGQVTSFALAKDGKGIDLTVFVNAPYDRYIDEGTRFWNASGVEVSVGATGFEVRTQSLVSVLAGGLAFDTPGFALKGVAAPPDTVFTVYSDQVAAMKEPDRASQRYVLYFDETLRGLSVGAPVMLLGLPAGEVTAVGLDLDDKTARLRGRVEIVTYPERLIARLGQAPAGAGALQSRQGRQAMFRRLIEERGLRAQLRSGSLLTGQLFVAFDYFPKPPPARVDWTQEVPALPAVPSTVADLQAKLTGILDKLDGLPYEAIGSEVTRALTTLNVTLQDASATLKAVDANVTPELKTTLGEARVVLNTVDGVLKNNVNTTLANVSTALEELRGPLATADTVLKNTDGTLVGRNAPIQQDLRSALQEITLAARSLRVLMEYLDQHPEALLRGKTEVKP